MSHTPPSPTAANAHNLSPNHPPMVVSDAVLRRRSADIGGLSLAMQGQSRGQGWLDSTGSETHMSTSYAELCATMYTETIRLVENNIAHNDPPKLSQEDRERLVKSLESWYFEPLNMPEHELLACVLFLFQVLFRIEGMKDAIKIDMDVIPRFILHIRQLYRWQNHYHNFEHAVDVLQAIHCYLHSAGMVPRVSLLLVDADAPGGMWSSTRPHDSGQLVTCLTPLEIFALYLTAIGHDIGHPGFNNPFMKKAEAPLSQVYDNQSALEQMHNYLLLMSMKRYGLGPLLEDPQSGTSFRKILTRSVLATDMGIHKDFMDQFEEILREASNGVVEWQTPKCLRQAFVCQLLLKNADISNPCRPFLVSKQWASALQKEWACQYRFENFLQLQHSVSPSSEPLAEAKSQVFFTKHIAKPLVDMTTIAIPELRPYSYQCAENLREWERILRDLEEEAPVTPDSISTTPSTTQSSRNPSSTSISSPSPDPQAACPPGSPSRQDFNTSSTTTPNIPPYKGPNYLSTTTITPFLHTHPEYTLPPLSSASPPIPISTTTSVSTTTSISTTTSSSISSASASAASSSNPVSPRVTFTDNDFSTAFRLALPRVKSDYGFGSNFSLSPSVTPGSGLSVASGGFGGRSRVSRTPSSSGIVTAGGGGTMSPGASSVGVLSPSLSRAAARVVSSSVGSGRSLGSGSPPSSSSAALSSSPSPPHMHSKTSSPRSPPLMHGPPGLMEDHVPMDGFRFPLNSPTASSFPPAPPPTAADPTRSMSFYAAQQQQQSRWQPSSQPQSQSHSSASSVSPSDSPSQHETVDTATDNQQRVLSSLGVVIGGSASITSGIDERLSSAEVAEDEYELDVQAHRANFHHVIGLGLGMRSVKRKKSSNVLKSLPFGYSPSPPPSSVSPSGSGVGGCLGPGGGRDDGYADPVMMAGTSASTVQGGRLSVPYPSPDCGALSRLNNPNRASWCPGTPLPFDVERTLRTKEDARGAIESWRRGRWGSASFGVDVAPATACSPDADVDEAGCVTQGEGVEGESESDVVDPNQGSEELPNRMNKGSYDGGDDERHSIPTGLVSAAPILPTTFIPAEKLDIDPRTPLQQANATLSIGSDNNDVSPSLLLRPRSGSPTPRAKNTPPIPVPQIQGRMRMRMETEEQKKKRLEDEEAREEKRRQKLREELIREEEIESKRKMKRAASMSDLLSSCGGSARSRSRSKARRKAKGKK